MPATRTRPRTREEALKARLDAYERLIRLDKPIGILLLLWPTLTALWLAAFGRPPFDLVLIFALGTLLMRSAGCAFNDWADREFDAARASARRSGRSPRGEIAPWEALVVAAALALCAFAARARHQPGDDPVVAAGARHRHRLSVLQALLRAAAGVSRHRVFVRHSDGLSRAVYDDVPLMGWWLFALNLFWVMAYDTEYAMVDRDDDRKLGLRTSAITLRALRRAWS